jgi:hypothetical protein
VRVCFADGRGRFAVVLRGECARIFWRDIVRWSWSWVVVGGGREWSLALTLALTLALAWWGGNSGGRSRNAGV